jgi:hypothetical protein
MALWKKLWLLFSVIWVVVAALNVFTILAFAEGAEREKFLRPLLFAFAVPAALYLLGWLWERFRRSRIRKSGSEP